METTTAVDQSASSKTTNIPARWAWWGVAAGALGLFGNLISSHASLTNADAASAIQSVSRSSYHIGTVAGVAAFFCLVILASGWRRWAAPYGVAEHSIATAVAVSATLALLGTGIRGGLSEYLPSGINGDNFDAAGVYVLFVMHDTAPWFAWWGVLAAAGIVAYLAFRRRTFPRWLGVVSVLGLLPPLVVLVTSGAVALAGLIGPVWLVIASLSVAVRGLPEA